MQNGSKSRTFCIKKSALYCSDFDNVQKNFFSSFKTRETMTLYFFFTKNRDFSEITLKKKHNFQFWSDKKIIFLHQKIIFFPKVTLVQPLLPKSAETVQWFHSSFTETALKPKKLP